MVGCGELEKFIESNEYLFHVTDKNVAREILESGIIKALTFSGSKGRPVKTASFTEDPIELLENCWVGFYPDKTTVLIFKRRGLEDRGVFKVKYVCDDEYNPENLCLDELDFGVEREWRSGEDVSIKDCYIDCCEVIFIRIGGNYTVGVLEPK